MDTGCANAAVARAAPNTARVPKVRLSIPLMMLSEGQLQSHLHLPRSRSRRGHAAHGGGVQCRIRAREAGRIREVKNLPPELELGAIANLKLFEHGKIDGPQDIGIQNSQARVAIRKVWGSHECRRIEPFLQCRTVQFSRGDAIRALTAYAGVGDIAR